jgi:hypothetical protein
VCTYNVHYIICAVYMCSAVHMYIVHVWATWRVGTQNQSAVTI